MGSRIGVLGGLAVGVVLAALILVATRTTAGPVRRGAAAAAAPAAATPFTTATPTAPRQHSRPDVADYNVIVQGRRDVMGAAAETHRTILSCSRQVRSAFASGLSSFNDCASLPLRHNIYRARVEGSLLAVGLQNLKAGACREQAQAVGANMSDLGDMSQGWFDLYDRVQAAPVGSQLVSLRGQTRTAIRQLLQFTASMASTAQDRAIARACRPRPYDPAEHVAGAVAIELPRNGPAS